MRGENTFKYNFNGKHWVFQNVLYIPSLETKQVCGFTEKTPFCIEIFVFNKHL